MFLWNCTSYYGKTYSLIAKYPERLPDCELTFFSDSTGILIDKERDITQNFTFEKYKKHFLIISSIQNIKDSQAIIFQYDTMIIHRKSIYSYNEKNKLIFKYLE